MSKLSHISPFWRKFSIGCFSIAVVGIMALLSLGLLDLDRETKYKAALWLAVVITQGLSWPLLVIANGTIQENYRRNDRDAKVFLCIGRGSWNDDDLQVSQLVNLGYFILGCFICFAGFLLVWGRVLRPLYAQ